MRFASTLAALAIAATALGACGTSSAPSATPVPPTSAPNPAPTQIPGGGDDVTRALDGRSFTGTTINGHDLADVTKVRLAFKGLGINGSGGCNSMSGPYAVTAGILQVGAIGITEMACPEPMMAQDTWLLALLDGATLTFDSTSLMLVKDGVTLTLTDVRTSSPAQPLAGTLWILDSIATGETVSSVPGSVTASLKITGTDASVAFGCNSGGGSVTISDTTLTFGPVMSTMMACASPNSDVERVTAPVFAGAVPYTIDGTTLTLKGANGTTLTFRAAAG
ncbi:MAG: META domain-containing protein [Chloroflexota bacterium]